MYITKCASLVVHGGMRHFKVEKSTSQRIFIGSKNCQRYLVRQKAIQLFNTRMKKVIRIQIVYTFIMYKKALNHKYCIETVKPRSNAFDFLLYIARQMSSIVECCFHGCII